MRIVKDASDVINLVRTESQRDALRTSFGRYECMCCCKAPAQGVWMAFYATSGGFLLLCSGCGLSGRAYTRWNGYYCKKLLGLDLFLSIHKPSMVTPALWD